MEKITEQAMARQNNINGDFSGFSGIKDDGLLNMRLADNRIRQSEYAKSK
jgi:hypothetical protein